MKFTALMPHQTLTEEVEEVYVVAASEAWGTHESEFGALEQSWKLCHPGTSEWSSWVL